MLGAIYRRLEFGLNGMGSSGNGTPLCWRCVRARELCRGAAVEANTGAKAIASNKTIAAVANLVRADARHVTTIEQWDSDIAAFLTRRLRRRAVG